MRARGALLVGGVALLACVAASPDVHGSCLPPKSLSSFGTAGYFYIHTPAIGGDDTSSIVGRFWQPGHYVTTGNQACPDWQWLRHYPTMPPHTWYIAGEIDNAACPTTACPTSELIVTIEERTPGSGPSAPGWFAVGRVNETPQAFVDFDFSRIGRDWNLVPLPSAQVINSTSGEVFHAQLLFPDPVAGFHGLPGAQASDTITAFHLYQGGTSDPSTWTFVGRYAYDGGPTQGQAVLFCPFDGMVRLRTLLEFDDGEVLSQYHGASGVSCDTYAPGAGAIDGGGTDGLFVKREPTGELTLSWGYSCSEGDRISGGYEVYEGSLGDWGSHAPRLCSQGPHVRSLTLTPSVEDSYYLVVPYEDNYEGSYGTRSDGTERPQAVSACRQRVINACPP